MREIRFLHLLGIMLLFLSAALALSAIWAFLDRGPDRPAFLYSILITGLTGALLYFIFKSPRSRELSLPESFVIVTLAWFLAGLFGALPYHFFGVFNGSYLDAFFESVSGFTTTGATLITDIESLPRGLLFWRSLTQWLGGMGIIVLFLAILPRFGFRGIAMYRAELPGPLAERVVPRVAETARRLWLIYLVLTGIQAALLLISGVSLFDALCHALTTMSSGGFSTYSASVAALNNPAAEVIIIVFMVLTGVNFALYYRLLRGDTGALKNPELRFYLLLLIAGIILVVFNICPREVEYFPDALRQSAFQVVSITTTTGYTTANFDAWPYLSRSLLFFLMFTGACGGSTSGAMKQIRLMLLFKYAFRELYRLVHPSAVSSVKLGGRPVPEEVLPRVIGFTFLYLFFFSVSTVLISAMGLDFTTAASAVAASIGNVGPAPRQVGPLHTYAPVPAAGKALLSFLMILGRLEIYTVLVLFLPEARNFAWRIEKQQARKVKNRRR